MKRKILVFFIALIIVTTLVGVLIILFSFLIIKPATDSINQKLAQKFAKIVYIPQGLPLQTKNFQETIYYWEMETPQNEIVGVKFRYSTGFSKDQKKIEATVELPENGDASIFNKVLPSVIADSQALQSASNIEKANLLSNEQIGYSGLLLSIKPETKQTTRITWTFEKTPLTQEFKEDYQKLYKFPEPILKFLYSFQRLILDISGP